MRLPKFAKFIEKIYFQCVVSTYFNIPELDIIGLRRQITYTNIRFCLRLQNPNLDINKLHLDIAGIRPKIKKKSDTVPDFMFEWGTQSGWLDLWNIESPGLTASLAIGEHVLQKVKNNNLL